MVWVKKISQLYQQRKSSPIEVETLKHWVHGSVCQENQWRGKNKNGREQAIGAKRKDMMPLRDIQQNILTEKRNKVEAQVSAISLLMATAAQFEPLRR